jgi:UDPglucose 6-dehydrogenase
VTGVDIDADKVALLRRGEVPIAEPGLGELVNARLADGSLSFTTDLAGLATAEVVLLCVPTPVHSDGTTDLRAFDAAVETLSDVLDRDCVVVIKSTVPVGTTERTARALGRATVSNPEFLREGHARSRLPEPRPHRDRCDRGDRRRPGGRPLRGRLRSRAAH